VINLLLNQLLRLGVLIFRRGFQKYVEDSEVDLEKDLQASVYLSCGVITFN
jgi:hypothetical protein